MGFQLTSGSPIRQNYANQSGANGVDKYYVIDSDGGGNRRELHAFLASAISAITDSEIADWGDYTDHRLTVTGSNRILINCACTINDTRKGYHVERIAIGGTGFLYINYFGGQSTTDTEGSVTLGAVSGLNTLNSEHLLWYEDHVVGGHAGSGGSGVRPYDHQASSTLADREFAIFGFAPNNTNIAAVNGKSSFTIAGRGVVSNSTRFDTSLLPNGRGTFSVNLVNDYTNSTGFGQFLHADTSNYTLTPNATRWQQRVNQDIQMQPIDNSLTATLTERDDYYGNTGNYLFPGNYIFGDFTAEDDFSNAITFGNVGSNSGPSAGTQQIIVPNYPWQKIRFYGCTTNNDNRQRAIQLIDATPSVPSDIGRSTQTYLSTGCNGFYSLFYKPNVQTTAGVKHPTFWIIRTRKGAAMTGGNLSYTNSVMQGSDADFQNHAFYNYAWSCLDSEYQNGAALHWGVIPTDTTFDGGTLQPASFYDSEYGFLVGTVGSPVAFATDVLVWDSENDTLDLTGRTPLYQMDHWRTNYTAPTDGQMQFVAGPNVDPGVVAHSFGQTFRSYIANSITSADTIVDAHAAVLDYRVRLWGAMTNANKNIQHGAWADDGGYLDRIVDRGGSLFTITGTSCEFNDNQDTGYVMRFIGNFPAASSLVTEFVLSHGKFSRTDAATLDGQTRVHLVGNIDLPSGNRTTFPGAGDYKIRDMDLQGTLTLTGITNNTEFIRLTNVGIRSGQSLTINRDADTETRILRVLGAPAAATLGSGVEGVVQINVTRPALTGGRTCRVSVVDSDENVLYSSTDTESFTWNSVNHPNIANKSNLRIVASGYGITDFISEQFTTTDRSTHSTSVLFSTTALPSVSVPAGVTVTFSGSNASLGYSNGHLTFGISGAFASSIPSTEATNALLASLVKGTNEYNSLIAFNPNRANAIGQTSASVGSMNGDYLTAEPGQARDQSIGYISNSGTGSLTDSDVISGTAYYINVAAEPPTGLTFEQARRAVDLEIESNGLRTEAAGVRDRNIVLGKVSTV